MRCAAAAVCLSLHSGFLRRDLQAAYSVPHTELSACRRDSFNKFLREDVVYLDGFAACYQLSLEHAKAEPEDVQQALQELLQSVRVEQERQQADLQVQKRHAWAA